MSAEYQTTFDESNDIVKDTSQTVSSGIWSEGTIRFKWTILFPNI